MNLTVTRRMIGAEILKLRRNRGTMGFALVLTAGVVILFLGISQIEHASNPLQHPPAGGVHGFRDGVRAIGLFFGMLAAILIGSEAGTSDRASGVFRDLVVTGRSRLALFAVRLPAAVIVSLVINALAFVLLLIGTFAFDGGMADPSFSVILQSAGWLAIADITVVAFAVGVGSLTGSRAVTLTAVIGWQAVATNILLNVTFLGHARDALLTAALTQTMPVNPGDHQAVTMASAIAVIVLIGWVVIPSLFGAWRTQTLDA